MVCLFSYENVVGKLGGLLILWKKGVDFEILVKLGIGLFGLRSEME